MKFEPQFAADFYKVSHPIMYEPGTQVVYSNLTPRKSLVENDEVVFFGLQYFIKEYLIKGWNENFFQQPKDQLISEYRNFMQKTVGDAPYKHLEELHDLGYLPLKIKAVKEGTVVKTGTPVMTLYNTDDRFFWLTNFIESFMSCELWKACTSASNSRLLRQCVEKFASETCDNNLHCPIQNHDFSFRGMHCFEDSALSGAGHLLTSVGTDTIPAIRLLEQYYNTSVNDEFVGGSVPASEHSQTTIMGPEGEFNFFKRIITETYPRGIVSLVSDSYDYFKVISEYTEKLKPYIYARQPLGPLPAKVVFRPDSGDMVKIICGDPDSGDELERKGSLQILWEVFGGKVNDKGYKEINPYVGLIYGDGCSLARINAVLSRMKEIGFASNNILFGVGSYHFNYNITRDTYGWAVKCTYAKVNGEDIKVCKTPKTDLNALKKSHKGLMRLNADMTLDQEVSWDEEKEGILEPVFLDGVLVREQSLSDIRELLSQQ
jgi:nicotinamide phosphoribosyltransferase